jgi:hypothetical protein
MTVLRSVPGPRPPVLEGVGVDPRTDPAWELLARSGPGSLFTSPPWIRAVCDTYGFTPHAVVVRDGAGAPVGGLAWVPLDDPRGARTSSLPFSDRADPLCADAATWARVLDASGLAAPGAPPFALRCLDGSPAQDDPRLHTTGRAAWHGTPLGTSPEELFGRLDSSARRAVAKAGRSGVAVELRSDLAAVRTFHGLHVRLRKDKYRMLAPPLTFFERISAEFAPGGHLVTALALVDGEPVAGALFLEWDGTLYYKFGASRREHLAARPNDAVYWAGIRHGLDRGLGLVDWGLSDLDQPGLVAFKRKWASFERSLLTLRAGEPDPANAAFGTTLAELTRLLTDASVPDPITEQAGALLYRWFC